MACSSTGTKCLDSIVMNKVFKNENWIKCKTVYDQNVIAIMEDNTFLERSASSCFRKHPENVLVYKWNPEAQVFSYLSGNLENLGPKTRIQIVSQGKFLYKQTGRTLAAALAAFPFSEKDNRNIVRIDLWGFKVAAQTIDEEQYLLNEFLADFLRTLKEQHNIETSVRATRSLAQVDASGIRPRVEAELDSDNNLVVIKVSATKHKSVRENGSGGDYHAAKSQIRNLFLVRNNDRATYYTPVSENGMEMYLQESTRLTFKEGCDQVVEAAVINAGYKPQYSLVQYNKHSATVDIPENGKDVRRHVNVGADVGTCDVFYYDIRTEAIEQKSSKVRQIRSYKQLVDEINWLTLYRGLQQRKEGEKHTFFRYGNWVVNLNLSNFYVGDYFVGRICDTIDDIPENVRKVLRQYSVGIGVTYDQMKKGLSAKKKKYQFFNGKEWVHGRNGSVIKNEPEIEEAFLTLAIFVSESCRNFRTHSINMMAIDLIEEGKLTTEEFLEIHPMARGGSWPDPKLTGFDWVNSRNIDFVRCLELTIVRSYLIGRSTEVETNVIYRFTDSSSEAAAEVT